MNYQSRQRRKKPREEYAIVLDVIRDVNKFDDKETLQALGTDNYTLLELVPKQSGVVTAGKKVYIGDGKREEIQYIKQTIPSTKLSASARGELPYILMEIVSEKEKDFVKFFNTAGPITIRQHSLEVIHGLGKKHLESLLEEREKKEFESFEDLKKRCPYLSDPVKMLADRIFYEINHKYEKKVFIRE